ncbi:MAG: hypothetical protein ACJ79A_16740 [Gemmatimonadaceae bacterium]
MPHIRVPDARHAAAVLLLAFAASCGGKDDGEKFTGPGSFPDLVSRYSRVDNVAALSCTPQTPPAGGDVAFNSYQLYEPVRIDQSGSKVTLTWLENPNQAPDTGTVDMAGRVTLGFKLSLKEAALRQGRQFYVDVTGTFVLNRSTDGAQLTGTGSYENVFHEGSATAPVYATCTRSSTVTATRVAG